MRFEESPGRSFKLESFEQLRPSDLRDKLSKRSWQTSQRLVAKELGISPAYLSDILNGHREISAQVAEKLGYERVVTFVKFGGDQL